MLDWRPPTASPFFGEWTSPVLVANDFLDNPFDFESDRFFSGGEIQQTGAFQATLHADQAQHKALRHLRDLNSGDVLEPTGFDSSGTHTLHESIGDSRDGVASSTYMTNPLAQRTVSHGTFLTGESGHHGAFAHPRLAPITPNLTPAAFGNDAGPISGHFTSVGPPGGPYGFVGITPTATMEPDNSGFRMDGMVPPRAQHAPGVMSTTAIRAFTPAEETSERRYPVTAPSRHCPQSQQSRGIPVVPLMDRETSPYNAPTTLPGDKKHVHSPPSILLDHGYFPKTPRHLLKTCKDILERPLTDPNLGPAQRTKPGAAKRKLLVIPEDASGETRARLEATNRQVENLNRARTRESNRASAERKRRRERLHQDQSSRMIVELEPERNFWMAVAVAHGAEADL